MHSSGRIVVVALLVWSVGYSKAASSENIAVTCGTSRKQQLFLTGVTVDQKRQHLIFGAVVLENGPGGAGVVVRKPDTVRVDVFELTDDGKEHSLGTIKLDVQKALFSTKLSDSILQRKTLMIKIYAE